MSNADRIGTTATLDTLVQSIDHRLDEAREQIAQLEGARSALLAVKTPAPKPESKTASTTGAVPDAKPTASKRAKKGGKA